LFGRAFAFSRSFIDALLDITRLLRHLADHAAGIGVENINPPLRTRCCARIAYLFSENEPGVAGDLAREHHQNCPWPAFRRYSTQ